jgi:hypothetical protein
MAVPCVITSIMITITGNGIILLMNIVAVVIGCGLFLF